MVSSINTLKTFWKAQTFKRGNIYKNLRMKSSKIKMMSNIKTINPQNYYSKLININLKKLTKNKSLARSKMYTLNYDLYSSESKETYQGI